MLIVQSYQAIYIPEWWGTPVTEETQNKEKVINLVRYIKPHLCESLHFLCNELEHSQIDPGPLRFIITQSVRDLKRDFPAECGDWSFCDSASPSATADTVAGFANTATASSASAFASDSASIEHFSYSFTSFVSLLNIYSCCAVLSTSSYSFCRQSCWVWEILSSPLCCWI